MIIKSITLQNFYCYDGEVAFEFKQGLNVVIGDNGSGKSKLYDGFYWVLYEKCFDTIKRDFIPMSVLKRDIVSDKAKFEANIGDEVETKVSIVFYSPDAPSNNEYKIERSYTVKKLKENSNEIDAWQEPTKSQLHILEKDVLYFKPARNITSVDDFINSRILPPLIKDYMWFQGEQVDTLIDFKNQDTLTKAIDVLSDISKYKIYEDISKKAFEAANKEYSEKLKSLSSNKRQSDEAEAQKNELEKKLKRLLEEKALNDQTLAKAEDEKETLYTKVEDATAIQKLNVELKKLEKDTEKIGQQLEKQKADMNKQMFNKYWVLRNLGGLVEEYGVKFRQYEEEKLKRKHKAEFEKEERDNRVQTRLPINVPELIYVQQMLDEEHCKVCDRHAPKNGEAWLKIQELIPLQKTKKTVVEPLTKHDFRFDFQSLYQSGVRLQGKIEDVDESMQNEVQSVHDLEEQRRQNLDDITLLEAQIRNYMERSAISSTEGSFNIVSAFDGHTKTYEKAKQREAILNNDIEKTDEQIKKVNNQLRGLIREPMPSYLEEKREVLEIFQRITTSTRERVFKRLIEQLENEANKHYQAMTTGNKSVRGLIKLVKQKDGNFMPKIMNEEGYEMAAINDSNIILIKMAVIMAIISAKKNTDATRLYTLITDAPSSKFNDDYTIGFCKTVSQVYTQSIIMSKDFYSNQILRKQLLSDVDNLGNVYIIEPSINEKERNNRNNLTTTKKLINA
jgi:DNA sulfur modification protein DndD